jgi:cytochrome c-type biogenesis protein CcmH
LRTVSVHIFRVIIAAWLTAFPAVVYAVQPDEIMTDPAQEARARELSRELRCMVCQNQSIDDSEASLAHDLWLLVRERIAAGDTNVQVIDFLVARYGEFVLLKPRFKSETLLLWLLPPLVLVGGGLVWWLHGRRKAKAGSDTGSETEFQSRPCMEAILAARGAAKATGRARSFCVNGLRASGDDYLTALAFR